jgi:AcrR family transcriptional regulator
MQDRPVRGPRARCGPRKDSSIDAAVLQATHGLMVSHGYARTSIDLIANTAGVSRPAIYRRWSSKAPLVYDAVFPALGQDLPADDFAGEITRLCHGAVQLFSDPAVREATFGLLLEMRADPALQQMVTEKLEATARTHLGARVDTAVSEGAARPGIAADTLLDAIAGGAFYAVCVRNSRAFERAADELSALVLRGVLSPDHGAASR